MNPPTIYRWITNQAMRINQIHSYLHSNGFDKHQGLLFYGNDESALQFHLDLTIEALKKSGYKIINAPSLLDIDTGSEPGLFDVSGEKKITLCRGITGRDFERIKEALSIVDDSPDNRHFLIFVAGNLGSKIKLVTHFQNQPTLGSVPSYDLSIGLLRQVVNHNLKKRSLSLSPEHIDILVETYAGSPISLLTDMDKLDLYLSTESDISLENLKNLVNGSLKLNIDLLISGFLERNKEKILENADTSLLEAEPYLILRSLSRQLMTFCDFMANRKYTGSAALAMAAMKKPVFFTTKNLFQKVEKIWTEKLAAHALRHVMLIEKRFKAGDLSLSQFQEELCLFCR